jgi:WD40 repeat protein
VTTEYSDFNSENDVLCVKYDDQDKYYAASYQDGTIRLFNSITGKLLQTMQNVSSKSS